MHHEADSILHPWFIRVAHLHGIPPENLIGIDVLPAHHIYTPHQMNLTDYVYPESQFTIGDILGSEQFNIINCTGLIGEAPSPSLLNTLVKKGIYFEDFADELWVQLNELII